MTPTEIVTRLLKLMELRPNCERYSLNVPGRSKVTLTNKQIRLMSPADMVHFVEWLK